MATPNRPGQLVQGMHGLIGVTTDFPRARTPRISVMWVGGNYPVLEETNELVVIDDKLDLLYK